MDIFILVIIGIALLLVFSRKGGGPGGGWGGCSSGSSCSSCGGGCGGCGGGD